MKSAKYLLAQVTNPLIDSSRQNLKDPIGFFNKFIQGIFSLFMLIGSLYFISSFIMAAYRYISTQGDKNKLEIAKQEITHTLTGLFILFSVFAILKLIGLIFGIEGLENLNLVWPSLV